MHTHAHNQLLLPMPLLLLLLLLLLHQQMQRRLHQQHHNSTFKTTVARFFHVCNVVALYYSVGIINQTRRS